MGQKRRFFHGWQVTARQAKASPMISRSILIYAAFPCMLLGGCATPEAYPSLSIRDSERVTGTMEVPASPAFIPAPTAPATIEQLDSLAASARAAHQRFLVAAAEARASISAARGSEIGSDSWGSAQVLLANLESIRSDAMIALADIDRLFVDAAIEGGEVARIGAARDEIVSQVDDQSSTIAAMLQSIGS